MQMQLKATFKPKGIVLNKNTIVNKITACQVNFITVMKKPDDAGVSAGILLYGFKRVDLRTGYQTEVTLQRIILFLIFRLAVSRYGYGSQSFCR